MNYLEAVLLEEDILPLGEFETIPVFCEADGNPESYPPVVRLKEVSHVRELGEEARNYMAQIGKVFIQERQEMIAQNMPLGRVRDTLTGLGFTKESYQAYSLRKLGTNELKDFIQGRTRQLFEEIEVGVFRMQYAVAHPGWKTKFHRDHAHFRKHGFRAMVPLNRTVILSFLREGKEELYSLLPGWIYFVNIARLHRGFNPFAESRDNLIFQMAGDSLLLKGDPLHPLSPEEAAGRYGKYLSTEIMDVRR